MHLAGNSGVHFSLTIMSKEGGFAGTLKKPWFLFSGNHEHDIFKNLGLALLCIWAMMFVTI